MHERIKATRTSTEKSDDIVKGQKASRKRQSTTTKGQVTIIITQKADLLYQFNAQCDSNKSPSQATLSNVTKAERIMSVRHQSHSQASAAQSQGVQKTRNGK